jgi:hypothetical protein
LDLDNGPKGSERRVGTTLKSSWSAEVRYWHQADVQTAPMNVPFEGNNGHDADVTRCLLMTQSRHARSTPSLKLQLAILSLSVIARGSILEMGSPTDVAQKGVIAGNDHRNFTSHAPAK